MSSFKAELRTTQDAAINCLSRATRNKGLIKKSLRYMYRREEGA